MNGDILIFVEKSRISDRVWLREENNWHWLPVSVFNNAVDSCIREMAEWNNGDEELKFLLWT